ncbi:hypothetical protein A5711_05355 [Mycobacterium sp. E2238]|nr:hypothetical protein A5711_05355 [Mycobacterium sp. E2238]
MGGGVAAGDLPIANSISPVRRDNCQPPWKGVNSMGKWKLPFAGWAVLTSMVATTSAGVLSDQAMSWATKVIGR